MIALLSETHPRLARDLLLIGERVCLSIVSRPIDLGRRPFPLVRGERGKCEI